MRSNCPLCETDLSPNALSCPECGADEETGWKDEAEGGGLGIPDDDFDYDEFVENEFGDNQPGHPKPWVFITGVILLLAIFKWFF